VGTDRTVHDLDPDGTIRDWLASPAWSTPCDDLDRVLDATGSPWGDTGRWTLTNGPDVAPLKSRLYRNRPLVTDQPLPDVVEGGALVWRAPGDTGTDTGTWSRVHTGADGLLDWSQFCFTPEYRHSVAGVLLEVDQAEHRVLHVACTGPVAVWLDDALIAVRDTVSYMEPVEHAIPVRLTSGTSRLLLATWQVAFRECRHVARVRIAGLPARVVIPSPGADEHAARVAERALDRLAVGPWASATGHTALRGPGPLALRVGIGGAAPLPVLLTGGAVTLPLAPQSASGDTASMLATGAASMLASGEVTLTVQVDDPRTPVTRTFTVAALPPRRRATPEGEPARWRAELLDHVAAGRPGVARALARHTLDPDAILDPDDLAPALRMITARADCADFEAVGLLTLWHRIPADRWPDRARDTVRDALLGFKYWIDQPGLDAMCYFTENHQFVWHTAELLVGEAFPDEKFDNTGWTGAAHADHGRALAVEWLRRKLAGGFSEFDSNAYLAIDSLALVSLVEFAADPAVRRQAEALLDKVLLTLAANSWRGVHGAAHGRSYVPTLRSSRFEETAPIMWTLWGAGALNAAVLPATALATAEVYRTPEVVRAVATDLPDEWDGRQVYRGDYRFAHDLLSRPYGSDLRIWRTPDVMLASVQDYRSGLPGLQEHVWGATLGSEVQVFATHPAASTTSSSARPNAWAGHRVLPRAHQHRDTVLVLHRLRPGEHTHLWFPAPLLDEVATRGSWLAGAVGDGYVAVAAAGGLRAVTTGDEADQAWLPGDGGPAYVATVGRRAVDGDFADFVAALTEPDFGPDSVAWTARDGRRLHLTWSGPFTVDGHPAGVDPTGRPEDPPHLDNPACRTGFTDDQLVAEWSGHRLVLDLRAGRRLEPDSGVAER
jgi:hypothetical protein